MKASMEAARDSFSTSPLPPRKCNEGIFVAARAEACLKRKKPCLNSELSAKNFAASNKHALLLENSRTPIRILLAIAVAT